jgi:drug/metabolite transporter (DMT)-like permease
LGVVGVWLLAKPAEAGEGAWLNHGDALALGGAVFGCPRVAPTGRFADRVEPYRFVTTRLAVTGLISLIATLVRGTLPKAEAFWRALPRGVFGIFSLSGAVVAQTAAQRPARATVMSLTLQLEAVFVRIIGAIFLNEVMPPHVGGAIMMMAGAAIAQIHEKRGGRAESGSRARRGGVGDRGSALRASLIGRAQARGSLWAPPLEPTPEASSRGIA